MEKQVERLVKKLQWRLEYAPNQRILIAISGIPGSGKTTLAQKVTESLNSMQNASSDAPSIAAYIPMDGYHYSRAQLSAMPNAQEAHARRGAEFTFDGQAFLALVTAVKAQTIDSPTLYAPSFDHAVKDPKADDIPILSSTQVLIFEGNYLSLDLSPWKEAAALMDELWFVDVSKELARKRLVERHVRTGVAATKEEAAKRAEENDLVNGDQIVGNRIGTVDEVIFSREDDEWKPESSAGSSETVSGGP